MVGGTRATVGVGSSASAGLNSTRGFGGFSKGVGALQHSPSFPVPFGRVDIAYPPVSGGTPHSPSPRYLQELAPVQNVLG